MFLPVPPQLRAELDKNAPAHRPISPAAMPLPRQLQNQEQPIHVHRQDPKKNAIMFEAISPEDVQARKRALYHDEKAKLLGRAGTPSRRESWFEDPIALGTLLIMFPPIGLAALWSSKRYSNDARWALTVMTALTMCLAAAIVVAIVALRT
jgi:hypothetical protein